jgi:hypothetical protein
MRNFEKNRDLGNKNNRDSDYEGDAENPGNPMKTRKYEIRLFSLGFKL